MTVQNYTQDDHTKDMPSWVLAAVTVVCMLAFVGFLHLIAPSGPEEFDAEFTVQEVRITGSVDYKVAGSDRTEEAIVVGGAGYFFFGVPGAVVGALAGASGGEENVVVVETDVMACMFKAERDGEKLVFMYTTISDPIAECTLLQKGDVVKIHVKKWDSDRVDKAWNGKVLM